MYQTPKIQEGYFPLAENRQEQQGQIYQSLKQNCRTTPQHTGDN